MVTTYASIASEFQNQADGPLVLSAYQLGYSVALTVVSEEERFPFPPPPFRLNISVELPEPFQLAGLRKSRLGSKRVTVLCDEGKAVAVADFTGLIYHVSMVRQATLLDARCQFWSRTVCLG